MAGRGRGRGRSNLTFSIEAMGFAKGEGLPPSILQPTPLFPVRRWVYSQYVEGSVPITPMSPFPVCRGVCSQYVEVSVPST